MEEEQTPETKRVRLTGTRFNGGRLPVDSLVELQKYQEVVRIAAVAEWQQEHPGEEVPADLRSSVRLTIDHIKEGSADVYLAFEQIDAYVHYQTEARDAVDAIIAAAYSDAELPTLPALSPALGSELRDTVAQLGSTLKPQQAMEFYPDGPSSEPVKITIETRKAAVSRLTSVEDFLLPANEIVKPSAIKKVTESLVGRITLIDAQKATFKMMLADGQLLNGRYPEHPELLEDLREVVNSAAEGPLTRITGDLQYRGGKLFRFWETNSVERVEFDDSAWGARLTEFAALTSGWDGGEASQIASVALEGAQMLLRAVDRAGVVLPGVFPTDEGGVLLEWASVSGVRSVEVLEDGSFETFAMVAGESKGSHSATADLTVAVAFVEAEKA